MKTEQLELVAIGLAGTYAILHLLREREVYLACDHTRLPFLLPPSPKFTEQSCFVLGDPFCFSQKNRKQEGFPKELSIYSSSQLFLFHLPKDQDTSTHCFASTFASEAPGRSSLAASCGSLYLRRGCTSDGIDFLADCFSCELTWRVTRGSPFLVSFSV